MLRKLSSKQAGTLGELLAIAKLEVSVDEFDPTDASQSLFAKTLQMSPPLAGCPIHGAETLQVGKVHRGGLWKT